MTTETHAYTYTRYPLPRVPTRWHVFIRRTHSVKGCCEFAVVVMRANKVQSDLAQRGYLRRICVEVFLKLFRSAVLRFTATQRENKRQEKQTQRYSTTPRLIRV